MEVLFILKNNNLNQEGEMKDSLLEDVELARMYGEHIKEVEKGNSTTHSIKKPEDLFKLL